MSAEGLLRAIVGTALAGLVLVAAACGGDDAEDPAEPAGPAPGEAQPYGSLDEVGDALGCKVQDVGTGGNAGLKAFGVCNLGRHNVDIYLTSQRGLWEHLADQFPSVLGPNWIVVCPTGPEAARLVHDELGGTLEIPKT